MTRGFALLAVAFALLIALGMRGGLAHDNSRPDLDTWFKSLENKHKTGCCDGGDYQRVEDPDWETKDGKYRVKLKGEWHDVPDYAVLDTPNKVGPALVWPVDYGGEIHIRCFIPGAMT